MPCIGEQLVQRRAGTGGNDVECQRLNIFHAGVANFWVQPKFSGHFGQEGAFVGRRFEQRDLCPAPQELRQELLVLPEIRLDCLEALQTSAREPAETKFWRAFHSSRSLT